MSDFIEELKRMQGEKSALELDAFWKNHSVLQLPYKVVSYKGRAEALVLLYLYERAAAVPFYCSTQVVIELKVKEETICSRTSLGRWAVSQAIRTLEAAGCIRVRRTQSKVTGRMKISIYLLLHPQTKEPLRATPKRFGICHTNGFESPYVTVPKETREVLTQMLPAGRAVYLTTLAVASKRMVTEFGITREDLKTESLLGRNAFDRGLLECKTKRLLTYKSGMLTLHDPRTGKPSQRWKHQREFVRHENTTWEFDLNTVTATQWQTTLESLLKREFIVAPDGWTRTERGNRCPFCFAERCFAVNFKLGRYICHEKCGDNARGRLGQLVQRVMRVPMRDAKEYIKARCVERTENAA